MPEIDTRPMCFIDTNIFLELQFLDARWEECRDFLKKVERNEVSACTSDYVVYSAILEIEAKTRKKSDLKIGTFLNALSSLQGLAILRPAIEEMREAAATTARCKLDFDDSYVVACMTANQIGMIISFDGHFDHLEGITRREPIDILQQKSNA